MASRRSSTSTRTAARSVSRSASSCLPAAWRFTCGSDAQGRLSRRSRPKSRQYDRTATVIRGADLQVGPRLNACIIATLMSVELSVVIPIRNESPNIDALYVEMTEALERWGRSYEVLAIDDGSTDDSFDRLVRCQRRDPRWRIIRFRRNFGQTAAFSAGFRHARGRLIATADGDLQNDPRDLADMIRRAEEGRDIVCGWRKDRKDPWLTRRLPSELANKLISWSTGVKLHDYGCSLKVFRAEVVKPLKLYGEMHRFLPAIASEMGVTIDEVVVNHCIRKHGHSNYGLSRTFRVVLDLLTVKFLLSYSTRPLQMFGLIGVPMGLVGFAIAAFLSYERLFGHESIANRPLLLLAVLLIFSGIQLVTMGLLAEIMSRTYHESQDKPIYVIRDIRESPQPETLPHSLSV